jgi:hypothetical protein
MDMPHLNAEALAALADTEPNATEAEHLAACVACAREAAVYRALRNAGARTREAVLDAPLTSWGTLAPALRDAGVIRDGSLAARVRPWMRAAAVIVVAAGALALGRYTAPGQPLDVGLGAGSSSSTPAQLASTRGIVALDGTKIATLTDALTVMQRAEHDYRVAAAFIAAHDSSYGRGDTDRYRSRLAALDKVSDAALQAVNASPDDPILNQYLLSARSAREVTLQQLGGTLPAGVRLASY